MRNNKINNIDSFTQKANEQYANHIRTTSKRILEVIDEEINWTRQLKPLNEAIENRKSSLLEGNHFHRKL
jgi:hypothetical protein